jgi:hypothetical protein
VIIKTSPINNSISMALQAAYKQFLAAPNPSLLADNASLHYITTLITLNGPSEVIKHLTSQGRELKKKEEKFLDVVEGRDALAVEVHTTIEFHTGGGTYLPKLDDNFLADRTVTFPIVRTSYCFWRRRANILQQIHIVTFDASGKILQIRQNWDQGSLLKLIDVIGKTGRNWPIHDGTDQIKLIASSVKSAGKTPVDPIPHAESQETSRSRGNSTNVTRDPHASLSLFAPRDRSGQDSLPAVVAPRASAKPPPRDYHDLFVGNDSDNPPASPTKTPVTVRSESPSKSSVVAPKGGAGKNFAPSRLFEPEEAEIASPEKSHSAQHFYRPNPAKYQHFDFADGGEAEEKPRPLKEVKASKHGSQWNFDDFNTPAKVIPSKVLRKNDVRHWGNSDDEVIDSPIKFKKVHQPRKDAESQFEFQDDGPLEGGRRIVGRPRGAGQNNGLGLYKNNLYDEETGVPAADEPKQLDTIANVKDRSKDFDPHFNFTDDSPAHKPAAVHISEDRAKAIKMMDANWSAYDQSPNQKENVPASPTTSRPAIGAGKGPLAEATNTMSNRNDNPKGITIGGDGMGGKRGAGRQWGFGDESDGEEVGGVNQPGKFMTGRTQGKTQATGGDFWDF